MDKVQARIGWVLFVFSLVLALSKVAYCVLGILPWSTLTNIDRVLYFCYPLFFAVTCLWFSDISRGLQVSVILFEALFSLSQTPEAPFFGLSMLFFSMVLAYKYGLYHRYFKIKLLITAIVLYVLFVSIPLVNDSRKYIYSAEWLMFLAAFISMLWVVFKDSIEKIRELEREKEERYIKIISEAADVARDAINTLDGKSRK